MNDDATGSIELGGQTFLGPKHTPAAADLRGRLDGDDVPETLGPYQILQEIGRGGMGLVLRGRDEALKRDVAIKIIRPNARPNAVQRMRFIKEAQITGGLEHPGICPVHYLGWDEDGNEFFSMKLVSGQPLDKLLKAWHGRDAKVRHEFPLSRLISIFERVCETVGFAHSHNIIHRDLKPSNVMIGTYGEVWVLDWGLAKVIGSSEQPSPIRQHAGETPMEAGSDMTLDGTVMGTPEYMAPEQAAGEELDEGVDIFGLGALLYEILAGQAPYSGKTIAEVVNNAARGKYVALRRTAAGKNTPPGLAAISEMCMKRRRERRYAKVQQILEDLRAYAAGEPLRALPDTTLDVVKRFSRRHGRVVAVAAIFLMIVLTTLTIASVTVAQKDRMAHEADARRLEADAKRLQAEVEKNKADLDKQKTIAAAAAKDRTRAAAFEPFAKAMDLLLRGQIAEEAAKLLKQSLAIDPDFPEAQFALGEALRQSGLLREAALAYLKADELSRKVGGRTNLQAMVSAAFAYDGAGFYTEAEEVCKRAERDGANEPLALVARAYSLGHRRKVREARDAALQALKAAPYLWETHFAVGYATMSCVEEGAIDGNKETVEKALSEFREAFELSPRQAETCVWIGNLLSSLSEDRKAVTAYFDRAISLEPLNGCRYLSRANYELSCRLVDAAEQDVAAAEKLGASKMQVLLFKIKREKMNGNLAEAFRMTGEVIRESAEWPSLVASYIVLGAALKKQNEIQPITDRWLKQNPEYAEVFAYKCSDRFNAKDYKGTLEHAQAGLKLYPYNRGLLMHLAKCQFYLAQFSEALETVDKILARSPKILDYQLIHLGCLLQLKRIDEADKYQKTIEADHAERLDDIRQFAKNFRP